MIGETDVRFKDGSWLWSQCEGCDRIGMDSQEIRDSNRIMTTIIVCNNKCRIESTRTETMLWSSRSRGESITEQPIERLYVGSSICKVHAGLPASCGIRIRE